MIAGCAGFDFARPTNDERDAMPSVPNVSFGPSKMGADEVSLFGQSWNPGGFRTAEDFAMTLEDMKARDPRRFEMANVGFHRTDPDGLIRFPAVSDGTLECFDLNRVS